VDFTREPIIETIITPKEGYKLVVRSSKSTGQEEYFVDAVEVVSFGDALFFRSIERPKCFLVPVSDYEILEVREARMVLKNVGVDQSIKIAGGRESQIRAPREAEKAEPAQAAQTPEAAAEAPAEGRQKRERKRHSRRRRGGQEEQTAPKDVTAPTFAGGSDEKGIEGPREEGAVQPPLIFSPLLQPPPTLISETISRYKETFKEAFFTPEGDAFTPHDKVQGLLEEDEEEFTQPLPEPGFEPFEEPQPQDEPELPWEEAKKVEEPTDS